MRRKILLNHRNQVNESASAKKQRQIPFRHRIMGVLPSLLATPRKKQSPSAALCVEKFSARTIQVCDISALNRLLERRVRRTQDHLVRTFERRRKALKERLRPRIPVRLEEDSQIPRAPHPRHLDRALHFGRMMSVVDVDAVGDLLEPAVREFRDDGRQRLRDGLERMSTAQRNLDRHPRVLAVMGRESIQSV